MTNEQSEIPLAIDDELSRGLAVPGCSRTDEPAATSFARIGTPAACSPPRQSDSIKTGGWRSGSPATSISIDDGAADAA